ncbi:uncharacterized protein FYW47_003482 [Aplochiton taeniatus]
MASLDSSKDPDRTEMERFGNVGMALLPWTRQILGVMWEHLRLLVHVIYYSFLSVFQMFRFEVHVRITDETGQHVQHMSSSTDPTESFFSSLFDGDKGVLSGGTNPLSNFCADVGDPAVRSHAEALLSSLRAEDLCCGLVDNEDGLFLGHHSSWKMGFPGDWNIFLSSTDSSGTDETSQKSTDNYFDCKQEVSEEEKWVMEDDQKFDSEDSRALWESFSKSSDPYNPLVFSASIKTTSSMGKNENMNNSELECIKPSRANEMSCGLNFWASRSDSESSWGSSDGSCADLDKEEGDRLWEFLSSPVDPYNPMCFTACSISSMPKPSKIPTHSPQPQLASFKSDTDTEERGSSCGPTSSEDDEEEQLWNSLCQNDDPYHPLNFQACLQSSPTTPGLPKHQTDSVTPLNHLTPCQPSVAEQKNVWAWNPHKTRSTKPILPERHSKTHCHSATTVVPWTKPRASTGPAGAEQSNGTSPQKKVRFSPVVKMHVMRTWPFARQSSRHGRWEEIARDRDRFRRRIRDTEQAIGYCLSQSHREKIGAHLAIQ